MAYNKGNGCYAVSLFNAIAPYKSILTGNCEFVAIRSKNYIMREIECGLVYCTGLKFIKSDTFTNLLNIHVASVLISPEDMTSVKFSYIKLTGMNDTIEQTFIDKLIELSSPNKYGRISTMNLLIGILKYRQQYDFHDPISVVLNFANVHYITIHHLESYPNKLLCVDDGILNELPISLIEYNIVAAIEVISPQMFQDNDFIKILEITYCRDDDNRFDVDVHEIDFDHESKNMILKVCETVRV